MSSPAQKREPWCSSSDDANRFATTDEVETGYVPLIQRAMVVGHLGLRRLELSTRINRARLGRILHRDPIKRYPMTLVELQTLLHSLDIDPIEAIVTVEIIQNLQNADDVRFAKLAVMLSTLFRGLPQRLVAALHDFDEMDGTEIRQEWGAYFQRAMVNRIVHEVGQILDRRARLAESADPFSF